MSRSDRAPSVPRSALCMRNRVCSTLSLSLWGWPQGPSPPGVSIRCDTRVGAGRPRNEVKSATPVFKKQVSWKNNIITDGRVEGPGRWDHMAVVIYSKDCFFTFLEASRWPSPNFSPASILGLLSRLVLFCALEMLLSSEVRKTLILF